MKEISNEVISIDEKEYKLFLNRKGLVAWEKYAKEENSKIIKLSQELQDEMSGENAEINADTNPFENIEDTQANENDKVISSSYRKLYWIMLYENHKLSLDEVNKLYDKAVKEYGEEQLIALAMQMIEDINTNRVNAEELKKLPALKPKN